ncbi:MAG: UDP-2,3-diacylglucosamine diphosphatase LpxI [Candidatus Omnitrophica bacterium]|nr:UDP-2,3-diacylglucosamine diphosphatase LpxI [Candidatus Omnitrophota bacterium]
MEKIGLIAGNRKFPLLFCEAAKRKEYFIIAIAIKGDTSARINKLADKTYWLKLSEFKRLVEIFKAEGVKKIVMAGQISPARLFSREVRQSPDLQQILSSIKNKKADTIFGVIAGKLEDAGLELLNSATFMEGLLPKKGTLTQGEPDKAGWEDVYFGFELAKAAGALDIGQTVAVKDKAIVAVEALEGTDKLIRRAGKIARGGITVIKVAKPRQDMRFDIPVVGLKTVQSLIKAGAKCLAIEADKTLFIDRLAAVKLADKKGLAIVSV